MDYIKELNVMEPPPTIQIRFNPCCDGLYKRTGNKTIFSNVRLLFQSLL